MQVKAVKKNAALSAQKAALVLDQIRGMPVERALTLLTFSDKKAAALIKTLLDSAIANAEHNHGADIDELRVAAAHADKGMVLKRMRARARGRGNRILKRYCHITVVVSESTKQEEK